MTIPFYSEVLQTMQQLQDNIYMTQLKSSLASKGQDQEWDCFELPIQNLHTKPQKAMSYYRQQMG